MHAPFYGQLLVEPELASCRIRGVEASFYRWDAHPLTQPQCQSTEG